MLLYSVLQTVCILLGEQAENDSVGKRGPLRVITQGMVGQNMFREAEYGCLCRTSERKKKD